MLTRHRRRTSQAGPALGILAATVVELPDLDGAQIAILGLHHDQHGTIVHMLTSGVTLEDDWEYSRESGLGRCCGSATAAAAGTPRAPTA